ncbi:MAG: bifunctional phosphopantothenoylcysteine decarboxylase/phosphopantothenate--cysteine ligase CoaBC [Deltaproteobacteria bacterium]|nr:MAG: bifunctional phosphopantothenoylcysteine decarboxylase/phosphopantothenate--cysteine ligase CoaBC [Deltaproteobacteria bacterium]
MENPPENRIEKPQHNKTVVIGVTGGIAAYKIPAVARGLIAQSIDVYTIMTKSASEFVTPTTLSALTGHPVYTDLFSGATSTGININHITLADSADLIVVAPATANTIAKLAHGIADNLLTSTILAATSPILVCPSMNVNMYTNKVTQNNISVLKSYGMHVLEPGEGELACGWEGKGRLPEPERIVLEVKRILSKQDLAGINILITSGPTMEDIDPVRFITNRSSGKMGHAITEAACLRGANVKVITGPVNLDYAPWAKVIKVRSAKDMFNAVKEHLEWADVLIMAAAVADFVPSVYRKQKIKKLKSGMYKLELRSSIDILANIKDKKGKRVFVGFAAETNSVEKNAVEKLKAKALDLIIANKVGSKGTGFASDTNTGSIISQTGTVQRFNLMPKHVLAGRILDMVVERMS